jgi:hypothetical protein
MKSVDEFVAVVRLPNGLAQWVTIWADHSGKAQPMLDAQYGCVLTLARSQRWT